MNARRPTAPRFRRADTSLLAAAIAQALCLSPAAAWAVTDPVIQPQDDAIFVTSNAATTGGPACTLRDAIVSANTGTPTGGCTRAGHTIVLQAGASYTFSDAPYQVENPFTHLADASPNALPAITGQVRIQGAGATIARDPAADPFRLFAVAASGDLELDKVTVANGHATEASCYCEPTGGGAVANFGRLTITGSTFVNNLGLMGGAILSTGETYLGRSTVSTNGSALGGGIANIRGSLTVNNSTISGNMGMVAGGGLHSKYGTLAVAESTISDNGAILVVTGVKALPKALRGAPPTTVMYGGGIAATGNVTIARSTISGNQALLGGGLGILPTYAATVSVTNSTVSGNQGYLAGGALVMADQASLRHVTIAGNDGGGLMIGLPVPPPPLPKPTEQQLAMAAQLQSALGLPVRPLSAVTNVIVDPVVNVSNTVIADNPTGDCHSNGPLPGVNNLIQDGSCGATPAPALLGPLADNGGPTKTHALGAGSRAIDAGDASICSSVGNVDQRGWQRGNDGNGDNKAGCDIGAFEFAAVPIPTLTSLTQMLTVGLLALTGLLGLRRTASRQRR